MDHLHHQVLMDHLHHPVHTALQGDRESTILEVEEYLEVEEDLEEEYLEVEVVLEVEYLEVVVDLVEVEVGEMCLM